MKKTLAAAAAATVLTLAPAAAQATASEPVICEGALQNQIVGDVTIPFGTDCTLTSVIVVGNVVGDPDSNGVTFDRTVVHGAVDLTTPASFTASKSAVTGTLNVFQSNGPVSVTGSVVGGDVSLIGTRGELLLGGGGNVFGGSVLVDRSRGIGTIGRNLVADDLKLTGNRGQLSVTSNVVRGSIDCTGNTLAPIGSGNAAGQKLGQCTGL